MELLPVLPEGVGIVEGLDPRLDGVLEIGHGRKSLGKGKYGRILGIPYTEDGKDICQILIDEGHAVQYHGGKKVKVWGE